MAEHDCPFFIPQRSSKLSTSTTTVQNECELKSAPICSPRRQFGAKPFSQIECLIDKSALILHRVFQRSSESLVFPSKVWQVMNVCIHIRFVCLFVSYLGHNVFYLCFSSSARIDFSLWGEKKKQKKFKENAYLWTSWRGQVLSSTVAEKETDCSTQATVLWRLMEKVNLC